MSALSPKQFDPQYGDGLYHGTHHNIEGDTVLPASRTSHKTMNFAGLSYDSHAFATENEGTAWTMGGVARSKAMEKGGANDFGGRVRVHSLEPHPEMEVGRYHPDHEYFRGENLSEHIAPEFKIKDTIDIKEGHQGTLPINWNQFAKERSPNYEDDYNHPTDNLIEHGHADRFGMRRFQAAIEAAKVPEVPTQPERLF